MKIAEVQINLWDKPQQFVVDELDLQLNDYVIVDIAATKEIGRVIEIKEIGEKDYKNLSQETELSTIIRKANWKDLEKLENYEKNKQLALDSCKKLITKNNLPMKLVDVHFSFDDKKITFAFISESRVDFRQLVKDLTRQFQKNIRLQQLGVRDEAKVNGDIGACGVVQCCKTHLKELGNVSADQAELQQVSHRGAERLSGICNRLKCCLRYENELYKELTQKLPQIGSQVKTSKGKGEVVDCHILKQTVSVRLGEEADTVVELPLTEIN
ncbi:MAG: stage 0 sporulation protein [Candidatus Buchananbacteria bacterium]|nr:stage 0 sporulation protein [Candidatus Buchananbacteria bacterium]